MSPDKSVTYLPDCSLRCGGKNEGKEHKQKVEALIDNVLHELPLLRPRPSFSRHERPLFRIEQLTSNLTGAEDLISSGRP